MLQRTCLILIFRYQYGYPGNATIRCNANRFVLKIKFSNKFVVKVTVALSLIIIVTFDRIVMFIVVNIIILLMK